MSASDPRYGNTIVYLGNLRGPEGNAHVILGRVANALKRDGVDQEEVDRFLRQAMIDDYDHLLDTVRRWVTARVDAEITQPL